MKQLEVNEIASQEQVSNRIVLRTGVKAGPSSGSRPSSGGSRNSCPTGAPYRDPTPGSPVCGSKPWR